MFGERIKELRTSLGLNQIEFGRNLPVSKQSVSNWENGNILPSIDMLVKICNTYNVSADYLLGIEQERKLDTSNLTAEQISHIQQLINDIIKNAWWIFIKHFYY